MAKTAKREGTNFVPFSSIKIAERPPAGDEHLKLFYNPRGIDSFTPSELKELMGSICSDGLQQAIVVRSMGEGKNAYHELIAGERRFWSIRRIREENLPCFDKNAPQPKSYKAGTTVLYRGNFGHVQSQSNGSVIIRLFDEQLKPNGEEIAAAPEEVFPTFDGADFFDKVECNVIRNCSDERALRLAFTENEKHKGLSIREEITLAERLVKRGLKQGEIKDMLGVNETWVSHTLNFREALPKAAFDKLLAGDMTRNVAVHIMSYKAEDRGTLYDATVKAEAEETKEMLEQTQDEIERLEDAADLADHDSTSAENAGDVTGAKKSSRKANSARSKAQQEKERLDRIAADSGKIKQSHVQRGAVNAGITPKKAKVLPSSDIGAVFVEGLEQYMEGDQIDKICGEEIPAAEVALMRATAEAIMRGERDPLKVLRAHMVEQGHWSLPDLDDEDDSEFDEDDEDARNDALNDFDDEDPNEYDFSSDVEELENCFGDRFDDDNSDDY